METPTQTPTSTPTWTPTTGLTGSVTLQGRPTPPDAAWSVPLRVILVPAAGGPPAFSCTPTTAPNGDFSCSGLPGGSFVACVKHSHTLRNCSNVVLEPGENQVHFGTLREGDSDDSNCVVLIDFSILAGTFSLCSDEAGFDARADFDLDGCVVLTDFSLLATNFARCGDEPPDAR
jgi:hypothetical protein